MVTQTPDGMIVFQFYRPNVTQMAIAGDFNGWQQSFQMTRSRDGWWRSQIELAPGTYRFRYIGDAKWFTDYAAFGVEPGPFGWNSVLKVDAPQALPLPEPAPADLREPALATAASQEPATDERDSPWLNPQPPQRPARRLRRRPAMASQR
jgi:hypothetical protein